MSVTKARSVDRPAQGRATGSPATGRPLRVIQAAPCIIPGGGESIAGVLARALSRRGARVSVVCGSANTTIEVGPSARPLVVLPMRLAVYPLAVARFVRIVRANAPDVVHVHDDRSMLVAAPAVRLLRVPVFVRTYHMLSRARASGQGRFGRALRGIGYRIADFVARRSIDRGVVFVEAGRLDAIRDHGLSPGRVTTIRNGVDTERFRPLPSREPGMALRHEFGLGRGDLVVGAVGRLVSVKGHQVLLETFERVARAEPRARLVLVGDGPQRRPLELLVGRSEAADRIRLVGARPASPDLYGALDLLAYPSIAGAYGLVVLEAMACGLPVVASRLEGTDELIADGTNGILVPAADPRALADAILRLMGDAAERHRLGTRARADVVARYSEAQMIERYEALYASLLEHPSRRAYVP